MGSFWREVRRSWGLSDRRQSISKIGLNLLCKLLLFPQSRHYSPLLRLSGRQLIQYRGREFSRLERNASVDPVHCAENLKNPKLQNQLGIIIVNNHQHVDSCIGLVYSPTEKACIQIGIEKPLTMRSKKQRVNMLTATWRKSDTCRACLYPLPNGSETTTDQRPPKCDRQ